MGLFRIAIIQNALDCALR